MESMGAAAAEGSKSTKSLERESMDAAAAHQRQLYWHACADAYVAARSVYYNYITSGLITIE